MSEKRKPKDLVFGCKYCNKKITNNEASRRHHEQSISHELNKRRYLSGLKQNQIQREQQAHRLDAELALIKARAEDNFERFDLRKEQNDSLQQHLEAKDEHQMAMELYGEDVYKQLVEKPTPIDPTKAYNDFVTSLPTSIKAKYRKPISPSASN